MTNNGILSSIGVFDFSHNKLCDLYDSQQDLDGQAYNIAYDRSITDGVKTLSFSIPYKIDQEKNFRWRYLKSEYLIRLIYNGETEWFVAQKPSKHKERDGIYGSVTCSGLESSLKTKNIYKEFDDTNGIGTIDYLVDQILAGTGWHRGYTDTLYEADGTTEKIRSLTSGNKQGALGLMTTVCNLFRCYPIYKTDTKTVEIYNYNNRDMVLEGSVGYNLDALSVSYDSSDIITRLYVEGEYGDDGYIGIDSVNPTGLNYIMNFDYYRKIGVFTDDHETALNTYITDISAVKSQISTTMAAQIETEDAVNELIGQCDLVVYYNESGYTNPVYVYGNPTDEQKVLAVGDKVVVLKNDGTYRYATIETVPGALIRTGEYGIAKFVTGASGSIGAMEVQVEAKEKAIASLRVKIGQTTKADVIAEYNAEITRLNAEITTIYTKSDGLYAGMDSLMRSDGLLYDINTYNSALETLYDEQDDIESDFIIAMGDMLRDGYWNDQNYIEGQEQHLYDDAVEHMNVMSRPSVTYNFGIIRLHEEFGVPIEDFKLNALFRIHDDELDINENLFITRITIGIDNESDGSISVSNQDITINSNDLGALLSRMSQLSDLIEQKNTLYDRAKAITKNGSILSDRLNGQIDVVTNKIMSSVSNWHTDDNGNIVFLSADGGGAMMLSGAGFMLANSKDNDGNWVWRTCGTGEGLNADEIVAGFVSADRIESGTISVDKVVPGFGGSINISANPALDDFYEKQTGITITDDGIDIEGSKYLKLGTDGTFECKSSEMVIEVNTANHYLLTIQNSPYDSTIMSVTDPEFVQDENSPMATDTLLMLRDDGAIFGTDLYIRDKDDTAKYVFIDPTSTNQIHATGNIRTDSKFTSVGGATLNGETYILKFDTASPAIQNNLTTTTAGYALDARQGAVLAKTFGPSGTNAAAGRVPKPSTTAGTTRYLREDATWSVPPNTDTWRGYRLKTYEYTYSGLSSGNTLDINASSMKDSNNQAVATPSGYTPVAVQRFVSGSQYVDVSAVRANITGDTWIMRLYCHSGSNRSGTASITVLYLQT